MKKKFAFIMSVLICASVCFTSCGDSDDSSKASTASTTSASDTDGSAYTEETSKSAIKLPDASDAATEAETADKAVEGTDFENGTIENNVYKSEFAGIGFEVPDGWAVASKEQLLAMVSYGLDITGNENLVDQDSLENDVVYDAVLHGSNGETIMIVFENLEKTTLDADSVDEMAYLSALKLQLTSMVEGVTYSNSEGPEKIQLCGKTFYKYSHTAKYDSLGGYEVSQCYYCRKIGNLLLSVIMSSGADGSDMSVYESNFIKIN